MYAGTTIGKKSGHLLGVHQRIDRVARRHIAAFIPAKVTFPAIAQILHFEGNNGPDGIKRKSPSNDEPWHFIDPLKPHDRALIDMVLDHQVNLRKALKTGNEERAAFEAAWMAHAIVDGLTPAHHFPLGDKIQELFGIPHTDRISVKDKNIIKGINRRDTISKNWQYWGKNGVITSHFMFEMGVAMSILGNPFNKSVITTADIERLNKDGYEKVFRTILQDILDLRTFENYNATGWNRALSKKVRSKLVPLIIKGVALGWYAAMDQKKK